MGKKIVENPCDANCQCIKYTHRVFQKHADAYNGSD